MTQKIFLILLVVVFLFPLYWMFVGSFQDLQGIMTVPPEFFPRNATLKNYINIITEEGILRWVFNTVIVTLGIVGLAIFISATAGYAFAIFNFKYKQLIYWILIATLMVSRSTLTISQYVLIKNIGLSGTLAACILPIGFSAVYVIIAKNYIMGIPKEILDSARIDGANEMQIMFQLVLPMAKPIFGAIMLFSAFGALCDLLWQSIILHSNKSFTLLVGLTHLIQKLTTANFGDQFINPLGLQLAIGVILFIPMLIIFLLTSKLYVNAMSGGLKM